MQGSRPERMESESGKVKFDPYFCFKTSERDTIEFTEDFLGKNE